MLPAHIMIVNKYFLCDSSFTLEITLEAIKNPKITGIIPIDDINHISLLY